MALTLRWHHVVYPYSDLTFLNGGSHSNLSLRFFFCFKDMILANLLHVYPRNNLSLLLYRSHSSTFAAGSWQKSAMPSHVTERSQFFPRSWSFFWKCSKNVLWQVLLVPVVPLQTQLCSVDSEIWLLQRDIVLLSWWWEWVRQGTAHTDTVSWPHCRLKMLMSFWGQAYTLQGSQYPSVTKYSSGLHQEGVQTWI